MHTSHIEDMVHNLLLQVTAEAVVDTGVHEGLT